MNSPKQSSLSLALEPANASYMTGKSHDCDGKLGFLKAFVEYGMRHNTEGKAFSE